MPAKSVQLYERERRVPKPQPPQKNRGIGKLDVAALIMVVLLLVVGLIALFSASYPAALYKFGDPTKFIRQQAVFGVVGIAAMLFVSMVDYHVYARFQKALFLVGIVLLILVLIPGVGKTHNNATRWIELPVIGEFQPSELMKTAVILSFSYYAAKAGARVRTIRGILPYLGALALIALLLYREPHLSATIIIIGVGLCILFVAGIKVWYIFPMIGLGACAFAVAYNTPMFAHVRDRIAVWINPFLDLRDKGWQGANSFVAIGSGGLWGVGLGQGRQKHLYLPEPQNDFIFSSWCEETGLIGAILVMIMFGYLIYRGLYIARGAKDKFGCLVAVGITCKLAIQTLVNLFVVSGLFPVTGASLPFFSYGGTALLIQLGEMGILLNISRSMTRDSG
ncbi:MAG: putative lipid II flippase FtsW [Butyricicoccus sp.]